MFDEMHYLTARAHNIHLWGHFLFLFCWHISIRSNYILYISYKFIQTSNIQHNYFRNVIFDAFISYAIVVDILEMIDVPSSVFFE